MNIIIIEFIHASFISDFSTSFKSLVRSNKIFDQCFILTLTDSFFIHLDTFQFFWNTHVTLNNMFERNHRMIFSFVIYFWTIYWNWSLIISKKICAYNSNMYYSFIVCLRAINSSINLTINRIHCLNSTLLQLKDFPWESLHQT